MSLTPLNDESRRGAGCPPNALEIVTRFQIPNPDEINPLFPAMLRHWSPGITISFLVVDQMLMVEQK